MNDALVSTNGVLIHSDSDWPCNLCRPEGWSGLAPNLLCVECATSITAGLVPKLRKRASEDGLELQEAAEEWQADSQPGDPRWDLFCRRYPKHR